MKVFISWSGERSGQVADALREWLPFIFEKVEPWLSRADIDAGARWGRGIESELEATSFGIICLTQENTSAPWVNFEAGAIAKVVAEASVVPYCFGFAPAEIPRGPLTLFQGVAADEEGTWDLVRSMHAASKDLRPEDRLRTVFDVWWPKLAILLRDVAAKVGPATPKRQPEEVLAEVLEIVRGLERKGSGSDSSSIALSEAFRLWMTATMSTSNPLAEKARADLLADWAKNNLVGRLSTEQRAEMRSATLKELLTYVEKGVLKDGEQGSTDQTTT